jgi:hypothetical protein
LAALPGDAQLWTSIKGASWEERLSPTSLQELCQVGFERHYCSVSVT